MSILMVVDGTVERKVTREKERMEVQKDPQKEK